MTILSSAFSILGLLLLITGVYTLSYVRTLIGAFLLMVAFFLLPPVHAQTIEIWGNDEITFHDDGSVSSRPVNLELAKKGNLLMQKHLNAVKEYDDLQAERQYNIKLEVAKNENLGRLEMLKSNTNIAVANSSSASYSGRGWFDE